MVNVNNFIGLLKQNNFSHGEVYLIQHYVIKFVSDLWQVSGFLRILCCFFSSVTLLKKDMFCRWLCEINDSGSCLLTDVPTEDKIVAKVISVVL